MLSVAIPMNKLTRIRLKMLYRRKEKERMETNKKPLLTARPPLCVAMMRWKGNYGLKPARIRFSFA